MNTKRYNWILYLILVTILATIAMQFYWNYKNYEQNKQRVLNEIQTSLDKALDDYYTNLSQKNLLTIIEPKVLNSSDSLKKKQIWRQAFGNVLKKKDTSKKIDLQVSVSSIEIKSDKKGNFNKLDSSFVKDLFKETDLKLSKDLPKGSKVSEITQLDKKSNNGIHISKKDNKLTKILSFRGKKARDSIKLLKGLKTVFITINNDSLAYESLDSMLKAKLKDKNIDVKFAFKHFKKDSLFYDYKSDLIGSKVISVISSSSNFKYNEHLELLHTDPSKEALKRSSLGILLSLLLSMTVISCLFYLLSIIRKQKELATIKNDLISNITHEFKTPITTVSTALEAINNFNVIEDKEKTKKYLSISNKQLDKLHLMVEKLLETATLDSEKLLLKKEEVDVVELVDKITNKHKILSEHKNLSFSSNMSSIAANVDVFHFENAVSNLIDNAIKYGGNEIEININKVLNQIELSVADNGNGIDKSQQEKIFSQFYRVPTGNTHNVKGFGIGLYYTKTIVEKHQGTLSLNSKKGSTVFKISIPNG